VNWDAVGAIAELLGAIATVAMLAYLAVQVRQSSATARAQIRQSAADSQINYLNSRATNPFLRRASLKSFSGKELDEEERYGLRLHLATHLRLFENHFAQYMLGTMDAEDWLAQREVLKMLLRNDGYRDAYSWLGRRWNAHFVAEVERILAEASAAAAQQEPVQQTDLAPIKWTRG
jgi:hypothetical protein